MTYAALLVLTLTWFQPVFAGENIDQDDAAKLRQQGEILPLTEILAVVEKQRPGRVIEVELEQKHGRYIYEIELVDDNGKVWEMKVNANDAQIISQEQED